MATTKNSAILPQKLNTSPGCQLIAGALSATAFTPDATNAAGALLSALMISSTDTSVRNVSVFRVLGGLTQLLTVVSVPANAGNAAGNPAINAFDVSNFRSGLKDENGNPVLDVPPGATITTTADAVTAAKIIYCTPIMGRDY